MNYGEWAATFLFILGWLAGALVGWMLRDDYNRWRARQIRADRIH